MALWGLLVLAMVGVVVGKLWPRRAPLPVWYPAATFACVDQTAKPFSSQDLRGRAYVADFIFTHCAGICPQMTARMATLQHQLPPAVQLVSFSVDPERDTPAALKEYSETYKADPARWHFLTGEKEKMFAIARAMNLAARPAQGEQPILHSEKLLLVDGDGDVRGFYDSTRPAEVQRLLADAARLVKETRQDKRRAVELEQQQASEPVPRASTDAGRDGAS